VFAMQGWGFGVHEQLQGGTLILYWRKKICLEGSYRGRATIQEAHEVYRDNLVETMVAASYLRSYLSNRVIDAMS